METVSGLEESPVSKFGSICRLAENAKSSDIDNKSARALYLSLLAVMGGGKLDNPEFSPLAIFGNVAIGRTTFGNVALGVTTFVNVAKGFTTFGNVNKFIKLKKNFNPLTFIDSYLSYLFFDFR